MTRPPFDPELAAALPTINEHVPPGFGPDHIPTMRAVTGARTASDEDLARGGAVEVREIGADEAGVGLLVCRPTAATGPTPLLYYLHGGGMIMGSSRGMALLEVVEWAQALGATVVSADYRLAPEHADPVPVEDCYTGWTWLHGKADDLGLDPARAVVVGTSAGGGLAAGITLMARDRGGPMPAGQMLLCPMLDDRNDTGSAQQMAGVGVWDRTANDTGWTALLGGRRGGPDVSVYAAPARCTDLAGLPPTFLDVGSAETFRDETVTYASALWAAGGQAELHVWPGGFHVFDGMVPDAELSRAARAARLPWLRRVLGPRA
ncbi:alpha/beta hydrolase [Actinomycetospora sp. TBRC 11914]|uniref:alpha/beta hydrolase n=1 Tax=Actinomycetospora sp. TBRC 11914 TaxID=2729387 RepID=UPI00145E5031|nr:alpha/beta hydrolase [Actinomycetospora sp. TBRC 11914]NMO88249.1 alpha/beta hydrolase [Actinomycetospora sp. TBRC 11914]